MVGTGSGHPEGTFVTPRAVIANPNSTSWSSLCEASSGSSMSSVFLGGSLTQRAAVITKICLNPYSRTTNV